MQWLRESRGISVDDICVVFHSPATETLANEVIAQSPEHFRKGDISWGKFEDGFPNIFIKNVESIHGRDVVFIASFLDHVELLAQLSVLFTLPRYLARSMIIVLPYFPTGTMERVDEEGQIATAVTFARLLSAVPVGTTGPAKIIIYDIHALQNRFYFGDAVIPLLVTAIPLFREVLATKHKGEKIVIAFPDDGACKRFGGKFPEYPLITCIKVRQGNKRVIVIKEGEEHLPDAHVFIVDDLVKTGGTLISCKDALLKAGAQKVSAFVSHAVFPQDSWKNFISESPTQFHRFYTTDSCPEMTKILKQHPTFEVLPLAASIAANILKY